ncbi:MAG: lysophospholipid acyltransferase family protein [Porticoccaceae bacterium]|nr:lysophospholipid acyltransferase family protein [Porticoccaceae bacterium]MBT4163557.1 lysophospholipid acyltransferase family protein [Porticoccaceae bacterium]MBT5003919.1 lysophospholipid acyltransferase family protein [Porticoccaceae bacterium]MBT6026439.1 lysophospholipid acyltransferase family protein [Porticoccaceae bacterium]MBT6422963.1 lysophospholipid acyltransferase family protein [Porticoccaceae bacterium]
MRNTLILYFLKGIAWLPLTVGRALGKVLGEVIVILNLQPARIAKINLSLCYPEMSKKEIKRLSAKRMTHLAQALFETPKVWRAGNAGLERKILAVKGLELFEESLSEGLGTILVIPHQGNWEVLGLWASQQAAMTSLYDPPRMAELEEWIKTSREQAGATLVPTNLRGVAALITALQRGEITGILPDQQPPPNSGAFAPLLGVQTQTMTLIHKLLQRSGSRALMCTALRVSGGWEIHFLPVARQLYSDDEQASLAALNQGVESIIELAPEQYQWEYKRFRARPEGEPPIYP